jgi:elongation factor P hydroxylase
LVNDTSCTNEERAAKVEKYILEQAVDAGVVKCIRKTTPKNPNKLHKTLAPWYNDQCREAKKEMA